MIYNTFKQVETYVKIVEERTEDTRQAILNYLTDVCRECHCVRIADTDFLTIFNGELSCIEHVKEKVVIHPITNSSLDSLLHVAKIVHNLQLVEEYDYTNLKEGEQ